MLIAINQPSRDTLLRGALATEMMGCDAARVAEISGNEDAADGLTSERFADYRDLWLRQGVGVMYRKFLTDERVSARMLASPRRRAPPHQPAAPRRADPPGGRDARIAGRAAALAGDSAARGLRRRSRAAAPRIRPQSGPDRHHPQGEGPRIPDRVLPVPLGRQHQVRWAEAGRTRIPRRRRRRRHRLPPRRRNRRRHGRHRRRDQARGSGRVAASHLRGADARGPSLLRDRRHLHDEKLRQDLTPSESTKSLLNWLVAGGRHRRRPGSPGSDRRPTSPPRGTAWPAGWCPTSPSRRCPSRAVCRWSLPGPAPETLAALPPPKFIAPGWRFSSFSGLASDTKSEAAANDHDARIAEVTKKIGVPPAGSRTRRHPALSARAQVPASACMRSLSASTSPIRPAGTTPSPAACPCIRKRFPACAPPSNLRC